MIIHRKIFDVLKNYHHSREGIVITGFRRTGKTTVLQRLYNSIHSSNKIFLDMESPVNQRIFEEENYDNVKANLAGLGLTFREKAFIFLDEIQLVKTLPSIIKYLYDHNDIKFYLTGSSSFYLKNHFSESMAGRKYIFELFPLDFEEFLWFKGQKFNLSDLHKGSQNRAYELLKSFYEEFLTNGGFPGVVLENSVEQKLLKLDDALGSYFQLDVQNLAHFKNNQDLKKLLFLLAPRVGSKAEVSKLANVLGVSRPSVYNYLDFFEQTYLIQTIRPISASRDVEIRNLPKIYFCDTGLLNRISNVGKEKLFENKVFNQLWINLSYRGTLNIFRDNLNYYQTKIGSEIDFVADKKTAFEVKIRGSAYDEKKLKKICGRMGIKEFKVVSLEKFPEVLKNTVYPYWL